VNGNLNLSRAIGDLKYKGNDSLAPDAQIITAQPDIVKVGRGPCACPPSRRRMHACMRELLRRRPHWTNPPVGACCMQGAYL
jgi:hypothetical protein